MSKHKIKLKSLHFLFTIFFFFFFVNGTKLLKISLLGSFMPLKTVVCHLSFEALPCNPLTPLPPQGLHDGGVGVPGAATRGHEAQGPPSEGAPQ